MLCVGYSDTDKVFIVRNSWGNDWGDSLANIQGPPFDRLTSPGSLPRGASPYGALDMIVDRRDLRARIAAVLALLMHQPRAEKVAEAG